MSDPLVNYIGISGVDLSENTSGVTDISFSIQSDEDPFDPSPQAMGFGVVRSGSRRQ